jgi:hypothetical protein
MTRFWQGLICLVAGCDLRQVTKTRVRMGNEHFALYVCDRCDCHHYMSEEAQ